MNIKQKFIRRSLELHLFFARIMKEHAIFLHAGFTPANPDFSKDAAYFQKQFENVLSTATDLSHCQVSCIFLDANEMITPYTLEAECQAEKFTGIDIDTSITKRQAMLQPITQPNGDMMLCQRVADLNMNVLCLLEKYISFKTLIIERVKHCEMFTVNYPLLLEHIRREAMLYQSQLSALQSGMMNERTSSCDTVHFWNQIMMEHAMFIRGLLDPTENKLIQISNQFVCEYEQLLNQACANGLIQASKEETEKLRDFKEAGTKGTLSCEVKSIFLALLADHVYRESNHYLRILNEYC